MSTEPDNRMVWNGQRGRYEVWYTTFNHEESNTGFWIRYTVEAPLPEAGEPHAMLWFARFSVDDPSRNFGIHREVPIAAFHHTPDPFRVTLGDASLEHGTLKGGLSGDAHEVSWDLAFKPSRFTHRHLPRAAYRGSWADSNVLSPNLMIYLNGVVKVDGETYVCDTEPGCQTHIWGRKHAHAWAWGHCNAFREDPTACLEILSLRLKRFGLVTPPLTFVTLYLGSEVYRFTEFTTLPLTRAKWETGLYTFSAVSRRVKLEGEFRCRPEDLLRTPYTDPDGTPCFCHNTEVANVGIRVWTRHSLGARFHQLAHLTSHGRGHFEYAAHTPDGHVPRQHVKVG